jgi:hypothetical protein
MRVGSFEEFIFEHSYGFTKLNTFATEEYRINPPGWNVNKVNKYVVNCDFYKMYGKAFEFLQKASPCSVFLAEGSHIQVKWKRNKLSI